MTVCTAAPSARARRMRRESAMSTASRRRSSQSCVLDRGPPSVFPQTGADLPGESRSSASPYRQQSRPVTSSRVRRHGTDSRLAWIDTTHVGDARPRLADRPRAVQGRSAALTARGPGGGLRDGGAPSAPPDSSPSRPGARSRRPPQTISHSAKIYWRATEQRTRCHPSRGRRCRLREATDVLRRSVT
jgi:hypothetical protein